MLVREARLGEASTWLKDARSRTNRQAHHELHWNRLKPTHRVIVSQMLGEQSWGRFISVVVCKRHLPSAAHLDDDGAYLYTLRFLAERISWFGRQYEAPVHLTIAHKVRFKRGKLEEYDQRLRSAGGCEVDWNFIDLGKSDLDQPKRLEFLQVADVVSSSTASAFESDAQGVASPHYLQNFSHRLYRPQRSSKLTSYGLKMHPWSATTKAAYPWVATL